MHGRVVMVQLGVMLLLAVCMAVWIWRSSDLCSVLHPPCEVYAKKAGEVVCVMVLVQLAPEPGVCDGSWRVLTGPPYIPRG